MANTTDLNGRTGFRRLAMALAALMLAAVLIQAGPGPTARAANVVPDRIAGTQFVDENGAPVFLQGVNYVGHTDRAWLMWDEGKFDAGLINADFAAAEAAGLNTVRIFVMKPLRDNINANNWTKLDKVLELARQRRLRLIVTFNDYDEPNLAKEAALNRKIVERYKDNPTVLAWDLKNEPQFGDLATADYPAGATPALQKDDFIKSYGERMSNQQVKEWRQTAQGKSIIPARFDERRAYLYANAYRLWQEFLADSSAWVTARSGKNSLDYMNAPESARWKVYLDALSDTLGWYIEVRQREIKAAQPDAIITIGWSNAILSKLRANQALAFISLHRFVPEGISGLRTTINMLENLRATFPDRPVVLEEFGYSNAQADGDPVDLRLTANHETALWLYLYGKGFAGGMKWMLVNFPVGFNKVQNNYGLLDDSSQGKPAYAALRAFTALTLAQGYRPGFQQMTIEAEGADIQYNFGGPNAFFSSLKSGSRGPVSYTQAGLAPFAAWWSGSGGWVGLSATRDTQVTVNLDALFPQRNRQQPLKLLREGQLEQESLAGATFTFQVRPGGLYRLLAPLTPPAFARANPIAGALYFKETGHNLGGRFRAYWEKYGGLAINGFPVSEEFVENGLTVQYFERTRYEYHPEFAGTRYEVLLGHLGRSLTAGREGEAPFGRSPAFPSNRDRIYFPETGHSLSYGFKGYWERNGGLAQFGFPITEEFQERNPTDGKTYTVQYFERARFEYHPEFRGTPYEVLLGHLGWQLVRANGWLS